MQWIRTSPRIALLVLFIGGFVYLFWMFGPRPPLTANGSDGEGLGAAPQGAGTSQLGGRYQGDQTARLLAGLGWRRASKSHGCDLADPSSFGDALEKSWRDQGLKPMRDSATARSQVDTHGSYWRADEPGRVSLGSVRGFAANNVQAMRVEMRLISAASSASCATAWTSESYTHAREVVGPFGVDDTAFDLRKYDLPVPSDAKWQQPLVGSDQYEAFSYSTGETTTSLRRLYTTALAGGWGVSNATKRQGMSTSDGFIYLERKGQYCTIWIGSSGGSDGIRVMITITKV